MSNLTSADIDAVCGLVDELCGIVWDESKAYLIESRLDSIVKQQGCQNYLDLVQKVRAETTPGLKEDVVDAVTTNETLWFRDSAPFEALKHKAIPELIDLKASSAKPKQFRVWSAACSTGQEVYSIAMMFADLLPDYQQWDIQILGTDISPAAIEQASRGEYNRLEISRGMDSSKMRRHFTERDKHWKISDSIRSMCKFKQLNLLKPFTSLGQFDIIFCRNVAIYFTEEDRNDLFQRTSKVLAPEGWLFVGSSECLASLGERWAPQQHCRSVCYRPNMEPIAYV